MAAKNITRKAKTDVEAVLQTWAKEHGAKVVLFEDDLGEGDDPYCFFVKKDNWKIEVRPENGWAYLCGHTPTEVFGGGHVNSVEDLSAELDRFVQLIS